MSGDVKLEETSVIVEASTLACHSTDLVLDHPDRRMSTTGSRRALVHDFNDGLTLNWANDYPGGVTIKGKSVWRRSRRQASHLKWRPLTSSSIIPTGARAPPGPAGRSSMTFMMD